MGMGVWLAIGVGAVVVARTLAVWAPEGDSALHLKLMQDIATTLRSKLGDRASKVPTRDLPDFVVRVLSLFVAPMRMLTPDLGRRNEVTAEKARRVLGFAPRPAATTVVDCAESLIGGRC